MEVDIPQVNGFSIQPRTAFTEGDNPGGNHVQFNSIAEVKVIEQRQQSVTAAPQQQSQRPKHKARRRARVPKLNIADGEDATTTNTLSGEIAKPLSPSKLKKMMDKDRHSRTGRRGIPKKGNKKGCMLSDFCVLKCVQTCMYTISRILLGFVSPIRICRQGLGFDSRSDASDGALNIINSVH